ncbi:porin [Zhongshania borealis]|uniref:Porin domain-containing protein n=1 Tax=Zhongshania borealis TaxID=889488 RepID=A0ABP7WI76_9GAMM
MKRLLLPASILLASGAQLAHADLSFYGKANVSYQRTEMELNGTEQWELNSNASRVGLKGSTPIQDSGFTVIYQAEYEIAVDSGSTGSETFKQRNTFVGIKGNFGTVSAGQFDTATKLLAKKVDLFNDLAVADIKNIMEGENRQKNIIQYSSPTVLGGLSFTAAASPGENRDTNEDNTADGNVFSVEYRTKQFLLALAHDTDIGGYDTTRGVATTSLGPVDLGLLIQTAELADDSDAEQEDSTLISAAFNASDVWVFKAQYGVAETELATGDQEKIQAAIGADYKVSSELTIFAYAAQVETDTVGTESTTDSTAGAGIWFKF